MGTADADPSECQTCMIRGQCSSFEKQVLTAQGRCKYHQGASCEDLFKNNCGESDRGWSMDT